MTRMLSELLGAREPDFRLGVQRLERASGGPNADIRLSSEIMRRTQEKIRDLGLDPHDTTGSELYNVLLTRLKDDEGRVRQALNIADGADVAAILSAVEQFIKKLGVPRSCFALKASVAKRLLKKLPPKKAMARLGYRSLESFIKHEPAALVYTAAWACESAEWQRNFVQQYSKLQPSDFEPRDITVRLPKSERWATMSTDLAAYYKRSTIYFKELGEVVLLPLPAQVPGVTLTSLLFVVQAINDIRSASVFLKLQQVKPNFGELVQQVVTSEPHAANVAGQAVPWPIVQHFYSSIPAAFRAELFEPHVQAEDLQWQQTEKVLAHAIPSLEFWADTDTLALLENQQPVTLNLFDMALNYCNQLPFASRLSHYFRTNVWHELLLRYLHQDALEQTVRGQLSSELVGEPALAEAL